MGAHGVGLLPGLGLRLPSALVGLGPGLPPGFGLRLTRRLRLGLPGLLGLVGMLGLFGLISRLGFGLLGPLGLLGLPGRLGVGLLGLLGLLTDGPLGGQGRFGRLHCLRQPRRVQVDPPTGGGASRLGLVVTIGRAVAVGRLVVRVDLGPACLG